MSAEKIIDLTPYIRRRQQKGVINWLKAALRTWSAPDFNEAIKGRYRLSKDATFEDYLQAETEADLTHTERSFRGKLINFRKATSERN